MNLEFLSPVKDSLAALSVILPEQSLAQKIRIHQVSTGIPDLDDVHVAIIGVEEDRKSEDNLGSGQGLNQVREKLYRLFTSPKIITSS